MTRKELLEFVKKTKLIESLEEDKREFILGVINDTPEENLAEVEKMVVETYEKQIKLEKDLDSMAKKAKMLTQKANKLISKDKEATERAGEEEASEQLLKEL